VVGLGTHEDLLARNPLYERLAQQQFGQRDIGGSRAQVDRNEAVTRERI
jgi:hypothetical protein